MGHSRIFLHIQVLKENFLKLKNPVFIKLQFGKNIFLVFSPSYEYLIKWK